jgi:hypothetical protein
VEKNQPHLGSSALAESYEDTYIDADAGEQDAVEQRRDKTRKGKKASHKQTRYWRRVPEVNVLPGERKQLPANFLLRSVLVVSIGLLVLVTAARYLDLIDFEERKETSQILSQSVQRNLAARQDEIEPIQSEINVMALDLEAAETTYALATAGQTDWNTAIGGLFAISVSGVEFLSATAESEGRVALVGVAVNSDAIASLPSQLSQLAGTINLQGIQWDASVSPPAFTAEFQVAR